MQFLIPKKVLSIYLTLFVEVCICVAHRISGNILFHLLVKNSESEKLHLLPCIDINWDGELNVWHYKVHCNF